MPSSKSRRIKSKNPHATNHPLSEQSGVVLPSSSLYESTYQSDLQAPIPFNNVPTFDRSCYFYHWQMPHVEHITDIKPSDGEYLNRKKGKKHF